MREYELAVIYDLAVAEAGGQQAAVDQLSNAVTARGGEVVKVDHWGRRRMGYPIKGAIDGDYVVSRVMLEPASVHALEAALGIDERIYRHLIVRADELPAPAPPREPRAPRRMTDAPAEAQAAAPTAEAPAPATAAPASPVATTEAEAPATAAAAEAEAPATAADAAPEAPASTSDDTAETPQAE